MGVRGVRTRFRMAGGGLGGGLAIIIILILLEKMSARTFRCCSRPRAAAPSLAAGRLGTRRVLLDHERSWLRGTRPSRCHIHLSSPLDEGPSSRIDVVTCRPRTSSSSSPRTSSLPLAPRAQEAHFISSRYGKGKARGGEQISLTGFNTHGVDTSRLPRHIGFSPPFKRPNPGTKKVGK